MANMSAYSNITVTLSLNGGVVSGCSGTGIFDGTAATPQTLSQPTVAITRTEAINQNTEGGQNAALVVNSTGNNANPTDGSIAMTTAITANAQQNGDGDVVAVFGSAINSGASGRGAFGIFANAEAAAKGTSAIAVGINLVNNTGEDQTLAGFLAAGIGSFGIDIPVSGNGKSAAGIIFRSTGSSFDTGIYMAPGVVTGAYAIDIPGFVVAANGDIAQAGGLGIQNGYGGTRPCLIAGSSGLQVNNAANTAVLLYIDENGVCSIAGKTLTFNSDNTVTWS
jgi:hypothetical protein